MITLPGLIDVHVHMREPGGTHKEDWGTGTAAALAGGVTTVLVMPNTTPSPVDRTTLDQVRGCAAAKARCDYGIFLGATETNSLLLRDLVNNGVGVKMYLDHTYGPLRLERMDSWLPHFAHWPADRPLAMHAEGRSLAASILLADLYRRPVHLCHVSREEEILVIRRAKERGLPVTCEVAPHHLILCEDDVPRLGKGRSLVCPGLARARDRQALWDNLDVVDCFATDHAPHTPAEKDGENPPPGFPGLETMLPLLLTAMSEGRLTMEDIVDRLVHNPRRIFGMPAQPETVVEVDPDATYEITAANMQSRCGWTPFEGMVVKGRVEQVVLRGELVYRDGRVLAGAGTGREVKPA